VAGLPEAEAGQECQEAARAGPEGPAEPVELRAKPPRVIVPRPAELEAKAARFLAAGAEHLQLIVDFDHTLTCFFAPDGSPAPMCHDVVEHSPAMPEAFREGYRQLWADQRAALARGDWRWETWWSRSHALMAAHGLQRQWLPEMVRASGMRCREGCRELFSLLRRHGIPVLIVSAGITQVIRAVLEREGVPLGEGVRVLANEMRFDEATGALEGFSEPVLHSFNKDSVGHRAREYFVAVGRKNAVLAGDSLGDANCLCNVPGLDGEIRVAFFNAGKHLGKRTQFEEAFDVLLSSEDLEPGVGELGLWPFVELLRIWGMAA